LFQAEATFGIALIEHPVPAQQQSFTHTRYAK
jgi:hypothetical protein